MTQYYIDNRAGGWGGDGSIGNPWKSIYDSAYGTNSGSVTSNDVVNFVAGSGPYREAFHSTRILKLANVTFNAGAKTITSAGSGLATTVSTTAGHFIRVVGSANNDGQYLVASGSGDTITVDSTCNLVDETVSGGAVLITNVTVSLGSYAFEQKRSAGAGTPVVWQMNGVEINSGVDVMTAKYKWNASKVKGEYYLTRADGSNPALQRPDALVVEGYYWNVSAGESVRKFGTVGALTLDLQPGWGNNDGLAFNTLYIKSNSGNPTTLNALWGGGFSIEKSELFGCVYNGLNNHTWVNGVFKFSNDANGTFTTAICTMRASATGYKFNRCTFAYAGGHGAELLATSGTQVMTLDHCRFFWAGHRAWYHSGASAGSTTLNVLNCTDWSSHLFGLIASGATATYTTNVFGNISANGEAGAIDKKSANSILNEDYNCWYPRMNAAVGALGYVSTANWAKTGANDLPAGIATTTNSQTNLYDPKFVAIDDLNLANCDFHLQDDSPCRGRGPWIYPPQFSIVGSFTDFENVQFTKNSIARAVNMGCYQSMTGAPQAYRGYYG